MQTRRFPTQADYSTTPTSGDGVTPPAMGEGPFIEKVGRPWRYVFPRQPSSSDPGQCRDVTVPMPEYVTNVTPGCPPEVGPPRQGS